MEFCMTLDSAPASTVNAAEDTSDLAIQTRNFSMVTGRRNTGRATTGAAINLDIPLGALFVVSGRFASGKTALLLALAGRLRGFTGTATVFGHPLRRAGGRVRHLSALAETPLVNRLDDDLTVERQIAAALVLRQPWWRPLVSHKTVALCLIRVNAVLRLVDARAGALLGTGTAGLPCLTGTDRIGDLQPLDRAVLGVVVALIGRPRLLIVDDVDTLRDTDDRTRVWAALLTVRMAGWHDLTIAASGQDPKELLEVLERINADEPALARPAYLLDLDSDERTLTALTRKA
jgi:energy-coupling factor transporter ATP-binding protein EcfA2